MDPTVAGVLEQIGKLVEDGKSEAAEVMAGKFLRAAMAQAGVTEEMILEVAAVLDHRGVSHSIR